MSKTKIYTTRKLEKIATEYISRDDRNENEYLGNWSTTLFSISHKKCWLIINKLTKYILILPNVKKSDLKDISNIFKENLYSQLICDGIVTEYKLIEKIIGGIELCETDNDKSANGSLNNCLAYFDDWKFDYSSFANMPFRELNSRLNSSPNKMLNWRYPKEEMTERIKAYSQQCI